jgi:hypothetical protein
MFLFFWFFDWAVYHYKLSSHNVLNTIAIGVQATFSLTTTKTRFFFGHS